MSSAPAPEATGPTPPSGAQAERPGTIDAVPVRHPWRWVTIAVILALVFLLVRLLLTNDAFNWSFVFEAMVQSPVLNGLMLGTLLGTVGAMVIGITFGIALAVMRLSEQPGALRCRVDLHVVLPRHPAARAAHHHGRARGAVPGRDWTWIPFGNDIDAPVRRRPTSALPPSTPTGSSSASSAASSASASPRRPTWPRSPAPASSRWIPASARRPLPWAWATARRCAASCCRRPCASSSRRPATRPSRWPRTPRSSSPSR